MYKGINEFFGGYLKDDKENMAEELANISIYALGIAKMLGVNLFDEITKKIEINKKEFVIMMIRKVLEKSNSTY